MSLISTQILRAKTLASHRQTKMMWTVLTNQNSLASRMSIRHSFDVTACDVCVEKMNCIVTLYTVRQINDSQWWNFRIHTSGWLVRYCLWLMHSSKEFIHFSYNTLRKGYQRLQARDLNWNHDSPVSYYYHVCSHVTGT